MVVRGTGRLIVRYANDHHKVKWVLFLLCVNKYNLPWLPIVVIELYLFGIGE